MNNENSFDRIVSYFHALANEAFTYNGTTYQPYDQLVISEAVFRSYTCPEGCGACCMRCSLMWDVDTKLENVQKETQTLNSRSVDFWVDTQANSKNKKCRYLNMTSARCEIYALRPLPCRFELFKFVHYVSKNQVYARVALPGRGWALTRITGEKGSVCSTLPYDKNMTMSHVADLTILKRWMDQFDISNDVDIVVQYLLEGPKPGKLIIDRITKETRHE